MNRDLEGIEADGREGIAVVRPKRCVAFRAASQVKAEAYRVGVEAIGAQGCTVMQLMQIIGEHKVRIMPDVAVTGAHSSPDLVDGRDASA